MRVSSEKTTDFPLTSRGTGADDLQIASEALGDSVDGVGDKAARETMKRPLLLLIVLTGDTDFPHPRAATERPGEFGWPAPPGALDPNKLPVGPHLDPAGDDNRHFSNT
jgi:hypothetical protein